MSAGFSVPNGVITIDTPMKPETVATLKRAWRIAYAYHHLTGLVRDYEQGLQQ